MKNNKLKESVVNQPEKVVFNKSTNVECFLSVKEKQRQHEAKKKIYKAASSLNW